MPVDRKKIIEILNLRGATRPCHRCGHTTFSLADQYSNLHLQDEIGGIILGGPAIPVILSICNHCGAITPHAAGALGLMPEKKEGKDE